MGSVLLLFKLFRLQALNVVQRIFSWCALEADLTHSNVVERRYKRLQDFIILKCSVPLLHSLERFHVIDQVSVKSIIIYNESFR